MQSGAPASGQVGVQPLRWHPPVGIRSFSWWGARGIVWCVGVVCVGLRSCVGLGWGSSEVVKYSKIWT
eukprot:496016-Prymnesium_polylepis.1